jgi:DNA-binding NarL/FixJ family response regulator
MRRLRVTVRAADPISQAGITSALQARFEVIPAETHAGIDVLVFAAEQMTVETIAELRESTREQSIPAVLVTNALSEADVLTVIECGVAAVVPRAAASENRLSDTVLAVSEGKGIIAPDLLGALLRQVGQLHRDVLAPQGLTASGLSDRECDVLRLMAEGLDTAEIATRLCYSERTVKNVIYAVTSRLNLRNRPHAVAYAVRAGVI